IALLVGGALGAIAGYHGGKTDNIIMRLMDILLAIPSILLAITIVAAFGSNMLNLMLAIGISSTPQYARIVRAAVLGIKDQEFIESARAIGSKDGTIILKEVIPNCLSPIIVQVTLGVAGAILTTASLSFIGLGIQPPAPEWGAMLSAGRQYLRDAWHITVFPGLSIMITILALNLLGDGLRDSLDPRLKQ
ncbi:MAG: ABC transporter permease, partial [Clostridium sp.]